MKWTDDPAAVRPMLASTGAADLSSPAFAYEPKYDGIRAIVTVEPDGHSRPTVRLWSRLGNEKTKQFAEIVAAVREWAPASALPLVLDGEIVALDAAGTPIGFQHLQGRIHLTSTPGARKSRSATPAAEASTALILFDILRAGTDDVRDLPLRQRRARLEALFSEPAPFRVRLSEQEVGDGRALHAQATEQHWEGLIAKRLDSVYRSGRRSPDWCKLKLERRQTCVVGGWTDPRGSRPFFGALLLGVHDAQGRLHYVGHTGAGFTDAELGRVWKRLQALQARACPFSIVPRTNERPHWVQPVLVAEVKFTEWTADRKLRHPTYLGLRTDVGPESVVAEPIADNRPAVALVERAHVAGAEAPRQAAAERARAALSKSAAARIIEQLDQIESNGGSGVVQLPGGDRLDVTNLGKVFWPQLKLTKGDLLRHYVRAAAVLLPVLQDRPLVMKRYPNGVAAKPFYQHRASGTLPPGVRVETVQTDTERRPHLVGGSLVTLLYTAQLASISQDPWLSRVGQEHLMDHIAIDLDPPDDMPFARVLDVAQWVRDELYALDAPAIPKTSGSGGLHIYVPMPPDTPYEAGLLYAQIVATLVSRKHPKQATIERSIAARGNRIYVDYMQNGQGKTLASAYSARANEFAGVSTPLTWNEVDAGVSPRDFTVKNFAERLASAGDLWARLRKSKPADLRAAMKYAKT